MLKGSIHINTVARSPKGSALILVVVLTVLLAAVGVLFLMTSRIDEMASSNILRTRELRAGVNVVLDRIRTVLTDDLFGGDDFLLDGSGTDEYWDYPGDDDPWLASLEPIYDPCDTLYKWPHITDLYGHISDISGYYEVADPCYPVSSGVVTQIIADNEPVGEVVDDPSNPTDIRPWGTRADADGDGVADSRWIALPDITSSGGENIYAAVRIIDNCGMININTAYRDPTVVLPWDGSLLTHINLDGIKAVGDSGIPVETFHLVRCNNFSVVDDVYHDQVARRLLNPIIGYLPFDIGDELELRNRYFLTSPVNNRFGYKDSLGIPYGWQVTFDPGPSTVGKRIPYAPGDDIVAWFAKVTSPVDPSDPMYCNRRHISTTYSFDRVIAPWADTSNMPDALRNAWYNWTNWNDSDSDVWSYRPVSVNDPDPNLIAAAIWLGLPDDPAVQTRFGPDYDREILAWQFALNLADYQDDDIDTLAGNSPGDTTDEIPGHIRVSLSNGNDVDFYGVEHIDSIRRNTLCISEVGYRNENTGDTPPIGLYFVVEIYNPAVIAQDLSNYELWIGAPPVTTISLSGTISANSVAVVGNQADPCDIFDAFGTFNATNYNQDASLSFSDGTQLMIVNRNWRPSENVPVDCINIPSGLVDRVSLDTPRLRERNEKIDTRTRLLTVVAPTPWPPGTPNPGGVGTLGVVPAIIQSWDLQLETNNNDLVGVGEIEKVFAAGYYYNLDTGECSTLVKSISKAIELLGVTDPDPDIPASNMRSYGRIRLADPDYHELLKYLTYFNPFSDGVDNDGNGSADEYDRNELAVAGRININTAPWFVINQLPWIALQNDASTDTVSLAQAIVAWRDMLDLSAPPINGPDYSAGRAAATGIPAGQINENPGFRNIGELLQVINTGMTAPDFDIRKYLDGANNGDSANPDPPDYSGDDIVDDFEERDILFHRVSNLVTVRSDVFTAYILIRIGQNGPQKRMIAVFDRSRVFSPADRPRLVVLHPVPDPR